MNDSVPEYELDIVAKISHMARIGTKLGALKRSLRRILDRVTFQRWKKELVDIVQESSDSNLGYKLDECLDKANGLREVDELKNIYGELIVDMMNYVQDFKNRILAQERAAKIKESSAADSFNFGLGILTNGELIAGEKHIKLTPVSYKIATKLAQDGKIDYVDIVDVQSSRAERKDVYPTHKSRMSKLKRELKGELGPDPFENCQAEKCYKLKN